MAAGAVIVAAAAWTLLTEDPLGGEPVAVVATHAPKKDAAAPAETAAKSPATPTATAQASTPATPPSGAQTVTIIDGSTGKREQVVVGGGGATPGAPAVQRIVIPSEATGTAAQSKAAPAQQPSSSAAPAEKSAAVNPKLLEQTTQGQIPKIGSDGVRPVDAYAQPAAAAKGPRVAMVVGRLGISANMLTEALAKLPGPVTLAVTPYGADLERWVARARGEGHEVLLQVPMEPFDYPENDPGPQTLLTSLPPEQNINRLHWFMARFGGYVGLANYMGARFVMNDASVGAVIRESGKRGLMFFDDGATPRTVTGTAAGSANVPYAKADIVIDATPNAAEIEGALAKLEAAAHERSFAVGYASALPVSIERIANWAKTLSARGVTLVPISAVANKPKSSLVSSE
ncbi:MAG: divergent polysaccharide deacetylase family protein [Rhizobiales bacterium]|nr:divergent polysaccharide deacetylase family protein [Hyphomicrobiales bacterium]